MVFCFDAFFAVRTGGMSQMHLNCDELVSKKEEDGGALGSTGPLPRFSEINLAFIK